jgi:hypothetical protein
MPRRVAFAIDGSNVYWSSRSGQIRSIDDSTH